METKKPENTPSETRKLSSMRPFIVVGRWTMAVICAAFVLFDPNANQPQLLGYAVLSFLLANAIWQHISLIRACVVAFILATVLALIDQLFLGGAPLWFAADALAAAVGSLLAYPVLQKIDHAMGGFTS